MLDIVYGLAVANEEKSRLIFHEKSVLEIPSARAEGNKLRIISFCSCLFWQQLFSLWPVLLA
jgi:hypothetical protein